MKTHGKQRKQRSSRLVQRRVMLEQLESRHLMAGLTGFYETFDPIDNSHWASIQGGVVEGAADTANYHDGNALHFYNGTTRSATTVPLTTKSGSHLTFNIRLGNSGYPWEDIDATGENVIVEYSIDSGASFKRLHTFDLVDPTFEVKHPWAAKDIEIPADAAGVPAIFRFRQLANSGTSYDHWGIDNVSIGTASDVTITDVVPAIRNSPVDSVLVDFSAAINSTSFDFQDVTLTRDGAAVALDSSVTIQPVSGNQYRLNGLTSFTGAEGKYQLTLDATGVENDTGVSLEGSDSTVWTVDTTPATADIVAITPNPRIGVNKAVSGINVTFTEPINLSTFDVTDLKLTRDGSAVPLDSSVTITQVGTTSTYRVNNLTNFTKLGGDYEITLTLDSIQDLAGNSIVASVAEPWKANDAPTISLGGRISYAEDGPAKAIAVSSTVVDPDTSVFVGGVLTVVITQNARASDQLTIINRGSSTGQIGVAGNILSFEGTRFGTFAGGTGGTPLTVNLEAGATIKAVQTLINVIAFDSPGEYLQPVIKKVAYKLSDGEGGTSGTAIKEIAVSPINDAPTLSLPPSINYKRNAAAIRLASNAGVSDPDNPTFNGGSLAIKILSGSDKTEQLSIGGRFSLLGDDVTLAGKLVGTIHPQRRGKNGNMLFIRFNANTTVAEVREIAQSITFRTLSSTSSTTRVLELSLWDGASLTTRNMDVNFS